jgi:hypothetical protein
VKGEFFNATLPALLPKRMVDRVIAGQFGLMPK